MSIKTENVDKLGSDTYFDFVLGRLTDLIGIDLSCYRRQQVRRRLNVLMERFSVASALEYCKLLEREPSRREEFRDFFTINVSEFFRNLANFEYLKNSILPHLLPKKEETLSIWSAGCSYGAEPYSVAILLAEIAPLRKWRILATDIDRKALAKARNGGIYTEKDVRNVPAELLRRYFIRQDGGYQVSEKIRSMVEFNVQNLLGDFYKREMNLILCRNVTIFFEEDVRNELYRKLHRCLAEEGVLFLGDTEIMVFPNELGFENLSLSFYKKLARPRPY